MHKFTANSRNSVNSFSRKSWVRTQNYHETDSEELSGKGFVILICISAFMFATTFILYVAAFLSSYSGAAI